VRVCRVVGILECFRGAFGLYGISDMLLQPFTLQEREQREETKASFRKKRKTLKKERGD
jgi:hypothetical protein